MEKTKELATMIQMFLKIKYNKDISVDNIIANIKVFDDNKFCYNCHSFIESLKQEGQELKLDQFKEDFHSLITIYSFFDKKK